MKNKHQKEVIKEMSLALYSRVEQSGFKIEDVAKKVPMSAGYLKQLKKGDRRLNIYYLYGIAAALNKYPSEMLPDSWQKPPQMAEINDESLISAICEIMEARNPGQNEDALKEDLTLALNLYKSRLKKQALKEDRKITELDCKIVD